LRTALADKGLEPDESYYIANEPRVRGSDVYRPGEDPPPDLAIEVDVTSAVLKRLPIYARLGVPELWRYVDDEVRFYRLSEGGEYMPTERSLAFPWMNSADVTRHLERRHDMDENSVVRAFVEWAKQARR
jgi:Uma2 family endonuclease